MAAHLTEAEARALKLPVKAARVRTTRKALTGQPYHSRCNSCGEEFRTIAAEDRHLRDASHARYEWIDG